MTQDVTQVVYHQIVLAERDVRAGILPENVSPSRWVQWAESKNIKIPSQLLSHDAIGVIKVKDSRKKWEIEGTLEYHCRKLGNKYIATMEYMPSVADIAKYVEQRLKAENKTGTRGDYWDWQTIKKEALTGLTGQKAKGKK